jgi:hypothetical protein
VHPNGTGYVERLYALRGFPETLAHQIEEGFFKPADNAAHDAMVQLESGGVEGRWTAARRSAWTRFILSLLMRAPEDIDHIRSYWGRYMTEASPNEEAHYAQIREADDPATFAEYLASPAAGERVEAGMFELLIKMVDNANIGPVINGLHWSVIDIPRSHFQFLTSDRAVYRPFGLGHDDAQIALPIGPYRLFVAARDPSLARKIRSQPPAALAKFMNTQTVYSAVRYVFGCSTAQITFVQNYFGSFPQPRLIANAVLNRYPDLLDSQDVPTFVRPAWHNNPPTRERTGNAR